jgi:alkanesulfonate monooxygenase SsuD/methylene tetrahydromethanopterin reductase-like flavin-dependent oxidoreductase (luciferase family)
MRMGQEVDALGFDELWSNDHFFPTPFGGVGDSVARTGPVFDGWATLVGWAGSTARARMGCLVSGAAYRSPGVLVKMATALDHASGGRAALGIGAGWFEREHQAFGAAFPALGARLDRLEEAAAICRGLLDGEVVERDGTWYEAHGARNDPPPAQPRLPLVIGGSGEKRTLRIVARYADIWNADGDDPTSFTRRNDILDEHCRAVGRPPGAIERTVGLPPPSIRATREEAVRALAATYGHVGLTGAEATQAADTSPFAAPVADVVGLLRAYRDAGVSAVMFDWPAPHDAATLEAIAGPVRDALERG